MEGPRMPGAGVSSWRGVRQRERRSSSSRARLRPLILLFTLGLALVPATPARANASTVSWSTPDAGADLAGNREVRFTVNANSNLVDGKITKWSVEVAPLNESHPSAARVLCSQTVSEVESVAVVFTWDTRRIPPVSETVGSGNCTSLSTSVPAGVSEPSANGSHKLLVRVTTKDLIKPTDKIHERQIDLDNAPADPTGLSATFNKSGQQMTVQWTMAPEPDVSGYAVDQCRKSTSAQQCSSSDWVRVAEAAPRSANSVTLSLSQPGAYSYRVAAKRAGMSGTLWSGWTETSTPVVLASESGGGSDGGSDSTDGTDGTDGSSPAPTNTLPKQSDSGSGGGGDGGPGNTGSTGGDRRRSGLPPRLIERAEVDAGYEEALPYGAKPLDELSGGGGLIGNARGVGLALVPVAGGLILFVFAMQMRYLSRRAERLAFVGEAPVSIVEDVDEPPANGLVSLGAGGSFISNWKKLLEP